jgi:signal transduction histidine kinase
MRRLFAPLANEEDRREIHRLQALPVLRDVRDALGPFLGGVDLRLSAIPPDFRLPPAPYAEWNALFQNVLINAINALLDSSIKRISVAAGQTGRRAWIRISDTGVGLGVPLHEANQLFDPFQRRLQISAERRALGLGGQGLGLTIVRMIAENRDARVAFVEPEEGYSTTFEVSWSSR